MTKIIIPYGNRTLDIAVPEKNLAAILYPKEVAIRDCHSVLNEAIRNSLGTQTIEDFLRTRAPMLFIVNDQTRPTRTAAVLDAIERYVQNKNLQFLVATGAHRAPTEQELRVILGKYYENHHNRIEIHDARDKGLLENYGKTRYGNELWLNNAVTRFERILVIGSVEPHYFAGFTGGRKSILPGIAGYDTIEQNHKYATHPKAQPLNTVGNPIHEEMVDCVRILDPERIYSIQMVLDTNYSIYRAFAGPIDKTFDRAATVARQLYCATLQDKADVVVTVAQHPFDINLYQTLKAMTHGSMALRPGGILIVVSPCREGLGPQSFARLFRNHNSMKAAADKSKGYYELGDHNAVNLLNLTESFDVWAITSIPEKTLKNARMKSSCSLQNAIERTIKESGPSTKVLFLMNGCLTVPCVV